MGPQTLVYRQQSLRAVPANGFLRCCIRALALEGFSICRARISPGNDVSQQLFRKLGFELCCN
jgi:L-amino acid N-acyltransferase YncA